MLNGFERRKEQKQRNILEAALALFIEQGLHKPSIAEIAKKADVSQVTIYNYFESKNKLTLAVFEFYVDKISEEFEQIIDSDEPFPEKIKQLIFSGREAQHIHEELYHFCMEQYTNDQDRFNTMYIERTLPPLMRLLDEGKAQGHVDPSVSNQAILIYIQALGDYLQRKDVYPHVLPLSEDITKLLFFGITGRPEH